MRRKSRRQYSAVCVYRPFSARRAARERLHTEKPAPKDTTLLRSGRTRNGWRGSRFAAEKCLPQAALHKTTPHGQRAAPEVPSSPRSRAAAIIIRCSGYSLRIFCREKDHGRPQSRCCARDGRNSCRSSENRTAPRIRKSPTAPATVRRNGTGPRSEMRLPAAPVKMKSAFCLSQVSSVLPQGAVHDNRMFAERAFYCIANGAGEQ